MGRRIRAALRRIAPMCACAAACLLLAQCSNSRVDPRYGVSASPRVVEPGDPVPKGGGTYRVGNPYVVAGRVYVPEYDPHYRAEGLASWYGDDFHGRYTANGEIFDLNGITAAHPTMPLPSYARVTNLDNGHSIIVRVNDRGPYSRNRVIDVSVRAAKLLDFYRRGTTRVRVEYVGRAPMDGSDDRMLEATWREHGPAPLPSYVRIAGGPAFPPAPPPPIPIVAGFSGRAPPQPPPPRAVGPATMSYAEPLGMDGTAQFLNGRGLY